MDRSVTEKRYSIAEYLQREIVAVDRHEYHDGEILAMSGGTYRHAAAAGNLFIALGTRLKGSPCRPLGSDMRVRIPSLASYVYPDISIVCGGPQFDSDDPKQTTITNPKVVIEVLSPSTEIYDRVQKFTLYRELASMQEYVLVSQDQAMIENYRRQEDQRWSFGTWMGRESSLRLSSLEITIPLAEIYDGVDFDDPAEAVSA